LDAPQNIIEKMIAYVKYPAMIAPVVSTNAYRKTKTRSNLKCHGIHDGILKEQQRMPPTKK
jgi:hypothetical protein